MKNLLLLLFVSSLVSCQSESLFDEYETRAETVSTIIDDGPRKIYITDANDGALNIGERQPNPFSITNIRKALCDIQTNLSSSSVQYMKNSIAEELFCLDANAVQPTHYHVKFLPDNLETLDLLYQDSTLFLLPFPFDCEISGQGTLPYIPADYDPETYEVELNAPVTPRYAIIPVDKKIDENINYEILDFLYLPNGYNVDDTHATSLSKSSFQILMENSMSVIGTEPAQQLSLSRGWKPSGCVQIYDTKLNRTVGVPNLKVHAYNTSGHRTAYTDEEGNFRMSEDIWGKVNIYFEWSTPEYRIVNAAMEQGYLFYSTDSYGPVYTSIAMGEALGMGTMWRALYSYYHQESNIFIKHTDFYPIQLTARYLHEYHPKYGGLTEYDREHTKINVWGLNENGEKYSSSDIIKVTFHELTHAAVYFGCLNSGKDKNDYASIIRESWCDFVGWYLLNSEYARNNYSICPRTQEIINGKSVLFDLPNWYNKQKYLGDVNPHYSPLFIDLVDDSNQYLYYTKNDPEHIYPNDNIVVSDVNYLQFIMEQSHGLAALKRNLIANKTLLGITEQDINNYFAFYHY